MYLRALTTAGAAFLAASALTAPASAATAIQVPGTNTYTFMSLLSGTINDVTSFSGLTAGSSIYLSFSGTGSANFTNLVASFNSTPITISGNGTNSFTGMLNTTAGSANTLTLSGLTGGVGLYLGSLTVTSLAAAVPEASTWAMMTLGFGALGYALRRRRTSFTFA